MSRFNYKMSRTAASRIFIVALWAVLVSVGLSNSAAAQSDPTYVSEIGGVKLDGRQCVPVARDLANVVLGKTLPFLGANGVAADLWTTPCPGWGKTANAGTNLPPMFSIIIWNRKLNNTGHLAMMIGTADARTRKVWVLDANWFRGRGAIHTVVIDGRVAGWMR